MKYDVPYEVVDNRRVASDKRIGPLAKIVTYPGSVELVGLSGPGIVIDDSVGFDDQPESGTVDIMTPEGRITLIELTWRNYKDHIRPFVQSAPDFEAEAELRDYFMRLLGE